MSPFNLAPFELLAIERRTGVSAAESRHPLLTSPLAKRRSVPTVPVPPELQAVIARAAKELPLS
jgi:hypothetical protein